MLLIQLTKKWNQPATIRDSLSSRRTIQLTKKWNQPATVLGGRDGKEKFSLPRNGISPQQSRKKALAKLNSAYQEMESARNVTAAIVDATAKFSLPRNGISPQQGLMWMDIEG